MSKIYFFRHAQASFGEENYDELSNKGKLQSLELGKYLVSKKQSFDRVYVGPLKRQQHTFEVVKKVYDENNMYMPEPIMENGLLEHNGHKAMEYMLPNLIKTVPYVKELVEQINANPKRKKANGLLVFQYFLDEWVEGRTDVAGVLPWKKFRQEVKKGLNKILNDTGSGENIAAFTSGGTIASITAESLKIRDEKRVVALNFSHRNTAFTSFFYSKNELNLFGFNELPHLEKGMITFV